MAAIGDAPSCKGKKVLTLPEQHKAGMAHVTKNNNKLSKVISGLESRLPSLKRKLSEKAFSDLKSGLGDCRSFKEAALDCLEDLKTLPPGEAEGLKTCEDLTTLAKDIGMHADILQDAITKHSPPPEPEQMKAELVSNMGDAPVAAEASTADG